MGSPTAQTWPEGMKLAAQMKFNFPQFSATPLQKLIPHASPEAIDLMTSLVHWDPAKRPTAAQALQHPFFQVLFTVAVLGQSLIHSQRMLDRLSRPS